MNHIIIVAAGRGQRFGADMPKQFVTLGDMPVLMHTIIRLARTFPKAQLMVVLSADYVDFWQQACASHGFMSPEIVIGGATRAESVKNAVTVLVKNGVAKSDTIMIHDGARPVIPSEMLRRIDKAVSDGAEAVIPVVPVTDSLRSIDSDTGEVVSQVVDRSRLVAVQTPQAFRADKLIEAYKNTFSVNLTDDASVYQAFTGESPMLVEGSPLNIKITHPRDIEIAALYMNLR